MSGRVEQVVVLVLTLICGGQGSTIAGQRGDSRAELLVFCSIIMVHPITEMARIFEQQEQVKVTIDQGGSADLFLNLETSRQGDLYIPGSEAYCGQRSAETLFSDTLVIGYNQAALLVAKGNPKQIRGDLQMLRRKDLAVVIGNEEISSVGKEARRLLDTLGIYPDVVDNAIYLGTDSRHLNSALKSGEADLVLNWRATAFFAENRNALDVIELDPHLAEPQKIPICLMRTSRYPELGYRFMRFAVSPTGQAILRRYGFFDASRFPD